MAKTASAAKTPAASQLYYGDNLDILREHVADASVDLVYLDPPFNSNATYGVLFKEPTGQESQAQIEAFEDSWTWNTAAEEAFDGVIQSGNTALADLLRSMRAFLHDNDMMAYLAMMAIRLIELHRVLRDTGSLYLHCDPTASHYLKLLLDATFGPERFTAEIIWRRTNARATTGRWPRLHDTILQYAKGKKPHFAALKVKADAAKMPHTLITKADGKKYQTYELTGDGETKTGQTGQPWRGKDPGIYGRHWGNSHAQLDAWDAAGLIHWPKNGGFPRRVDDVPFDPASRQVTVGDVWTDIDRLNQASGERMRYPTQKPVTLLERIVEASSKPGDVVLDPFCGCGTTIHAAQKLGRTWIGIDVTHLAISLIEKRLKDAFGDPSYDVHGTPKDLAGAQALADLDKYQFQWWAVSLVDAIPYGGKKKGADGGVDGIIYFQPEAKKTEKAVVSVKGGAKVGVSQVKDLITTVDQEGAKVGVFICIAKPTPPLLKAAAAAGFYAPPHHAKVPKIQVLTIEDLFAGRHPDIPMRVSGFKKSAKETAEQPAFDV